MMRVYADPELPYQKVPLLAANQQHIAFDIPSGKISPKKMGKQQEAQVSEIDSEEDTADNHKEIDTEDGDMDTVLDINAIF